MRRSSRKSKIVPPGSSLPDAASLFPLWFAAGLLGAGTLGLFWPALRCDFINYDDSLYVSENVRVQAGVTWENIKWALVSPVANNWHPLTMLSHMLDCQLFGLKPWGHHLTSVLLHAANTALVFLVFRRMTGAFWRSLFVAALFGWHPLRVESVAWVAERKDVLSTLFWLLTLWAYIGYVQPAVRRRSDRPASSLHLPASGHYWLALGFFALGLMSKPMLVTLPCVLLLLDYWPLNRASDGNWPASLLNRHAALLKEKLPFFALAAAASAGTFMVQQQTGALWANANTTLGARAGNALVSYCRYLGKMVWPRDLAVFYPHPGYWPVGVVLLAGGLIGGVTLYVYVRRQTRPYLLVGWLWFVGTLVPVIGLIQAGEQAMADRYTYIASLGLLVLVIWGACELARRRQGAAMGLTVAGGLALVGCAVLTWRQVGYWRDSETLFRHALAVTTNNFVAHNQLGIVLADNGQVDEAFGHYQEAVRINPDFFAARYNYGSDLAKRGRLDEAILQMREAARLEPYNSNIRHNLGTTFAAKGQYDQAIGEYQQALKLEPDNTEARACLGRALVILGRTDEAVDQFQEAIRRRPATASVYNDLGGLLLNHGHIDEAIGQFREAIRFKPTEAGAYNNLGIALAIKGQNDEAIIRFHEALRLKPTDASVHKNLGRALLNQGQVDEAISQFQEALRLKPDDAEIQKNLFRALAEKEESGKTSASPTGPLLPEH